MHGLKQLVLDPVELAQTCADRKGGFSFQWTQMKKIRCPMFFYAMF